MSTQSNALSEVRPAAISETRPMYWSVRRELWENRSIYVAPLAVAAVFLFGFSISTITLPHRMQGVLTSNPATQRVAITMPYSAAAFLMIVTAFLVGAFYCLDAKRRASRSQHPVLEVAPCVRSNHSALEGEHSARASSTVRLRHRHRHASDHAAAEHRSPARERPESRRPVDTREVFPIHVGAALRTDGHCALARAHLRLAAAGLGLGTPRDSAMGRVTAAGDQCVGEDCLQHDAFHGSFGIPHDRLVQGGFRLPAQGQQPRDGSAGTPHSRKVFEHA